MPTAWISLWCRTPAEHARVPEHVHTLGLAEAADDTVWLAQEPGPSHCEVCATGLGGGDGEGRAMRLRVAETNTGDSWTMTKAERVLRGEEKPEHGS